MEARDPPVPSDRTVRTLPGESAATSRRRRGSRGGPPRSARDDAGGRNAPKIRRPSAANGDSEPWRPESSPRAAAAPCTTGPRSAPAADSAARPAHVCTGGGGRRRLSYGAGGGGAGHGVAPVPSSGPEPARPMDSDSWTGTDSDGLGGAMHPPLQGRAPASLAPCAGAAGRPAGPVQDGGEHRWCRRAAARQRGDRLLLRIAQRRLAAAPGPPAGAAGPRRGSGNGNRRRRNGVRRAATTLPVRGPGTAAGAGPPGRPARGVDARQDPAGARRLRGAASGSRRRRLVQW